MERTVRVVKPLWFAFCRMILGSVEFAPPAPIVLKHAFLTHSSAAGVDLRYRLYARNISHPSFAPIARLQHAMLQYFAVPASLTNHVLELYSRSHLNPLHDVHGMLFSLWYSGTLAARRARPCIVMICEFVSFCDIVVDSRTSPASPPFAGRRQTPGRRCRRRLSTRYRCAPDCPDGGHIKVYNT